MNNHDELRTLWILYSIEVQSERFYAVNKEDSNLLDFINKTETVEMVKFLQIA